MQIQPLGTRARIAITGACGVALAISTLWFPADRGALDPDLWRVGIGALAVYGLAVVGAFAVDRWWALLPSVTTAGAIWLRISIEEPAAFETADPAVPSFIWALLFLVTIAPYAGLLLSGVLARRLWDRRSRRSGHPTTIPSGTHR